MSTLYDSTTRLPQSELFTEIFQHAIKHNRRHDRILALVRLVVVFRDNLDLSLPSDSLYLAALRIKNIVRENDLVGYLFDNEFAVVFSDLITPGDADRAVQRLLEEFYGPFELNSGTVVLKAAAGISLYPTNGDKVDDLMTQAKQACSDVNMDIDSAYRFVSPDIHRAATDRMALVESMQEAVAKRQFRIFYLPQYDLVNGTLIGVEALLRWQHPELGLLPAGYWVSLADEFNMIQEISKFVLEQISIDDNAWQQQGAKPVDLMLNFCTSECLAPNFVKNIHQTIEAAGIPCHRLVFEFSEDCIGYHAAAAWQSLTQLAKMGIRINIDNYGRGYTNVIQLKTWPLERIKIDRALIDGIVNDERICATIKALIDLGHALQLKVAANGVETSEQLAVLKNLGCDLAQGFALVRPSAAPDIGEILTSG
jgi:EAL domain-containing protein (putative c-di-GMP-specific phosphodiesterase class I)/GGDEF domain-containing protein